MGECLSDEENDDVVRLREDIDTLRALLDASGRRRLVDAHRQACTHLLNARVERLEQLLA